MVSVFITNGFAQEIMEKYRKKSLMQLYFRPRIIISYLLVLFLIGNHIMYIEVSLLFGSIVILLWVENLKG